MKTKHSASRDFSNLEPKMLSYSIGAPCVLSALTAMVNASIASSEFPNILKTGVITPVPKVNNPTEPVHYRPVAVQSILSLIIEKCVHAQTVQYLDKNKLLYSGQFGFRSKHSCEMAMIALTEYMYKEVSEGKVCLLVSLDLSKAFDVIVREYLMDKLRSHGIDPKWFQSYFSYRAQVVKDKDGSFSRVIFTLRGCPQGSVMGPLTFSVYLNDLPDVVKHCILILFADDSQLCLSTKIEDINLAMKSLTEDLLAIIEWMKANGMKLNLEKTQFIVIGTPSNIKRVGDLHITLDGINIYSQPTLKSLGLILDSSLTWSPHIANLIKRIFLTQQNLRPLKPILSNENLIRIFNASVVSLFNYMAGVWGSACAQTLQPLEASMRQVARFLLGVKKYDPVRHRINSDLNWLLPRSNYFYKSFCFIYLTLQNEIPYFCNFLLKNSDIHAYNTRNKENVRINFCPKNALSSHSIQFNAIIEWNKLSNDLKYCPNYNTFKKKVKKYLLESIDV